jgi:ABC-2 type transport system permease protein
MKDLYIALVAAAVIALRVWIFRSRRRRKLQAVPDEAAIASGPVGSPDPDRAKATSHARSWAALEGSLGEVGMVATREIKERVRGRFFQIGTLVVLIAVAAAIVIPTLHSGGGPTIQTVGVVGGLSPKTEQVVYAAGRGNQDVVKFVSEHSLAAAKANLRSGKVDFSVVDGNWVLLNKPATSSGSPADPALVQDVAEYLGVLRAYQAAGLTAAQATQVDRAKAVPVRSLQPNSKGTTNATSVVGLVLLFIMLTQYNTWILMGVMQEKSSRVVEVLLATVRPIQLLGGKVLGIGLVALAQATLIVGCALIVATVVGSDLLRGTATLVLGCELLWLVLGYAFYCWVYAAAGSTAERQDQVQTLALPLSIPILLGYVFSITVASSGNPDLFFKILAYLPPTAPFCMPVLVGLGQVAWWQFVASVLITIAGTVGTAIFAARIYRRAVLRTGARVSVRELLTRTVGE